MGKLGKSVLSVLIALSLMGYVYSQLQQTMLESRLEIVPSKIRYGEQAIVKVVVKNPFPEEKIYLQAQAIYEIDGEQYTAESNVVELKIDRTIPVSVRMNLNGLRYVQNSAFLDDATIHPVMENNRIVFRFELPNDEKEHVLQFKVTK